MNTITLTDFNQLIESLPSNQKNQTLTKAYQYVLSLIAENQAKTQFPKTSMAGFLAEYADPSKISQEKTAWQQAMVKKYATD